jgi:hypothetical protein
MDTKSFFEIIKRLDKSQIERLANAKEGKVVLATITIVVIALGVYFGYDVSDILSILGQGL